MSSGGNSNNDGNGKGEDEGWGSKLFKVATAAAAAAAVAGGVLVALSSAASAYSKPEESFQAHRGSKGPDDPWSPHQGIPSRSQVGWTKPEFGWVKLNVDGSRVHEGPSITPSAGCGGVLRDSSGTWLHGFCRKLDPRLEVHETEMWAIFTGLQLASDREVKKLVVESDHDSVVDLVKNGCKYSHPQFDIVTRIRQLLDDKQWQVRLASIPRNANRVANRLARNAHDMRDYGLNQLASPPYNCSTLLLEDAQGVTF